MTIFVKTVSLKGELNQLMFLLWLRLLRSFVLTGFFFNFLGSQTIVVGLHRRHWFIENFFNRGKLGEVLSYWRMVIFNMYVLDYIFWFLIRWKSAVVEFESNIQIIYYFQIKVCNYVQTIDLSYFSRSLQPQFFFQKWI